MLEQFLQIDVAGTPPHMSAVRVPHHLVEAEHWGFPELDHLACLGKWPERRTPESQVLVRYQFLLDPSPIIGYACHSLPNSLTHSCLVNLIDVTLTCEDANSKRVEIVTVANIDDEDHAGNSFLIGFLIGELTFGHKAKLLFRLWAQGLVKI